MTVATGLQPKEEDSRQTKRRREQVDLECRYGEIGIVAVTAALRYAGVGKKPAAGAVVHRIDERFVETAA